MNWLEAIACVKIVDAWTMPHSHTSMLFIGCIAHYILSLKNKIKKKEKGELNHCYKKEKNPLYDALTEPMLELE